MVIANGLGYDNWASQILVAGGSEGRRSLNVGNQLRLAAGERLAMRVGSSDRAAAGSRGAHFSVPSRRPFPKVDRPLPAYFSDLDPGERKLPRRSDEELKSCERRLSRSLASRRSAKLLSIGCVVLFSY